VLKNDAGEENDLIDYPEYESIINSMRTRLEKWFVHYVNSDVDVAKEAITGAGQGI